MRRDFQFIHLYDRPSRLRPPLGIRRIPDKSTFPLGACLILTTFVIAFFWIYDLVAHRELPYVPNRTATLSYGRQHASPRVASDVPAPDMNSPAVALANADVPSQMKSEIKSPSAELKLPAPKAELARKKRVRTRRHLPPEAAQAQASEPNFFRSPFGGF
jgi:hypothetical protein